MKPTDLRNTSPTELPSCLAQLHRACKPGDRVRVILGHPADLGRPYLDDALEGSGFSMSRRQTDRPSVLTRQWTLPDTVAVGMRVLISGLNPSPAAADAGVGFARPGNRFWPAALRARLVSIDRDPEHALSEHGVGMTDMVKRCTRRADELSPSEYEAGLSRLERLVVLFQPASICFVGLAGWRVAFDRRAQAGWQETTLGGRPVYLMPSTSGLNAGSRLEDLTSHLASAQC